MEKVKLKTSILKKEIINIFKKFGLSNNHALISANALINAELVGAYGHGLSRLKMYCDRINKKVINPKPKIRIKKISPSISHVDANNSIGFVAADIAIKKAIHNAKKTGIGMVAVKNSGHYGLSGYYAEQAVKKKFDNNDLYKWSSSCGSSWCTKKFVWNKPNLFWNTYRIKNSFYFRYIYFYD